MAVLFYIWGQAIIKVKETTRPVQNGRHTIFLSTKGTNKSEVPKELVDLLSYIGAEAIGGTLYDDGRIIT